MKVTNINFAPDAKEAGATSQTVAATTKPARVPESDELTRLNALQLDQFNDMIKQKPGSAESVKANTEMYKTTQLIKAEIVRIEGEWKKAELDELRNKRVAMIDELLVAYGKMNEVAMDKKADQAAKDAANDAFKAIREKIATELLAKYAASTPSRSITTTGEGTSGERGAKAKSIVELHVANLAAGMSPTESKKAIEAAGHSRGTTGAVVLAWEKEQGVK